MANSTIDRAVRPICKNLEPQIRINRSTLNQTNNINISNTIFKFSLIVYFTIITVLYLNVLHCYGDIQPVWLPYSSNK